MNRIRAFINGEHFTFQNGKIFSGGEIHVNVKDFPEKIYDGFVEARIQSSDDLMQLMMFLDAVTRKSGKSLPVLIPYMPYARQDRVCAAGDAFSIRVIAKMLSTYVERLYVYDLHSEAAKNEIRKYIKDVIVKTQVDIFKKSFELCEIMNDRNTLLVSPDKGAIEKTKALADAFNIDHDRIVFGEKHRDPTNGQLSGFSYQSIHELKDRELLIVDDICDGGGTFIGLANELKKENPRTIDLYVTHGIFSNGIEKLAEIFSDIYMTDSFIPKTVDNNPVFHPIMNHKQVHVIHL